MAMAIHDQIKNVVDTNDVVLFMKGTPQMPQCGFSGQVVQILDYLGVPYTGVNVLADAELRDGIKTFTNWPTIPQLYVKGEFVGGCDIIREMFQSGELQRRRLGAGSWPYGPTTLITRPSRSTDLRPPAPIGATFRAGAMRPRACSLRPAFSRTASCDFTPAPSVERRKSTKFLLEAALATAPRKMRRPSGVI